MQIEIFDKATRKSENSPGRFKKAADGMIKKKEEQKKKKVLS